MNLTIEGTFRGSFRKDTNSGRERHYLKIEQKDNNGLPVVCEVTSYTGLNSMKEGDKVKIEVFDSLNTWDDNYGKHHARIEYIMKAPAGSIPKATTTKQPF